MAEFRLSEADFNRATKAGEKRRETAPQAVSAELTPGGMILVGVSNGWAFMFNPRDVPELAEASAKDLAAVEVAGAGYGLYFPRLDVDISVPGVLEGYIGRSDWSRRESRAKASRANGQLGGRPKRSLERA